MIMKKTYPVFVASLLVGLIVACNATPPQPTQSPVGPSPVARPAIVASPLPASNAVPFALEQPLTAGMTVVRGTGPAGVPVFIADVTFMGEPLGTGTIGPDGKFNITVPTLESKHRIGLALGEMSGTQFKPEQFYSAEFQGPGAMQLPQVGYFLDTEMVK
jgi:hypothetical protein